MKILVGYIPTPEGLAALEWATQHALLTGAELTVLNTAKDGDYADSRYASSQDIDSVDADLVKRGVDHQIERPTDGVPAADSLVTTATRIGADLLVIGLRRRSPVGKLITGSSAQAILLDAPCPVVAVKAAHASPKDFDSGRHASTHLGAFSSPDIPPGS
jgi:nucleotide-binding universal stress UspA family protein